MIAERTDELAAFFVEIFGPKAEGAGGHTQGKKTGPLSDDEIIALARQSKIGPKFMRLWAGDASDYGGDDSAADLALLSYLAFYTQDPAQLDDLFRRSGLNREKWREREDYRKRTIERALVRDEVYEPGTGATITRSAKPGSNGKTPHADAGESAEEASRSGRTERTQDPTKPKVSLADVAMTYRKWLYVPGDDNGPIYYSLATVAANFLDSDPFWGLIVGASSGGKTELITPVTALSDVYMAATLTEASLLSGTPNRDKASGSKGGLLRVIGDFGILALKDFTSILSMNRDRRAELLAALREIFDGSWTRHVGTDGGKTLSWSGKLGLIGGCTAAIDSHHGVMSVMGERFLLYRLPEIDRAQQARRALSNAGHEKEMRDELAVAVRGLFSGLDFGTALPPIDEHEIEALTALSDLATASRSGVVRDGYQREIDLILDTEAPARLAQMLRRLYAGLIVLGLDRETAWPIVRKTGLDCMPKLRRSAFDILLSASDWTKTADIAATAGYPTTTARRSLEDLAAHGVVIRKSAGGRGQADLWQLSDASRAQYAAFFPEMSKRGSEEEGSSFKNPYTIDMDISGKSQDSAPPCGESTENEIRRCWRCKAGIRGETRCEACGWVVCECGACSSECSFWQEMQGGAA